MSSFTPSDEYIAELLEHSDIEDDAGDFEDPEIDFCPDFEPTDQPSQEHCEKWEEKTFQSKTILEKMPIPIAQTKKPIEYFSKYFPDELFERMAKHTRRSLESREKCFKYCNMSVIRTFFGVYALMGIVKCPQKQLYFNKKFQYTPVSSRITYEKFRQIRTSLHVIDKDNPDDLEKMTNRLWKVQPVIDSVRFRCQQLRRDSSHYSIGEQMILFTSPRIGTRFNWGAQPIGLKNFIVTNPEGLVIDFEIYQGSLTDLPDRSSLGTETAVVIRLARTLPGACLYFGRNFTTVPLMNEMARRGINATGSIKPFRFRKEYELKKDRQMCLGQWQEICRSDGKVCSVKWMDSKASLIIMSTAFGSNPLERCERFVEATKQYRKITCPLIVKNYKRNILGVHFNEQLLSTFTIPFKCKKWPVNVILHLFEMSVVNSYLEYRMEAKRCNLSHSDTLDAVAFHLEIIDVLLGEDNVSRNNLKSTVVLPEPTVSQLFQPPNLESMESRFDGRDHWLIRDMSIKSQRQCFREKCKGRTNNMCCKCKVYLCFNQQKNCFYTFHNKLDRKPD